MRSNQLVGYGLVVGLDGTGDQTTQAPFTVQSIVNMLAKFGVTIPSNVNPQLKNVAAVTVTAELPPFSKPGQTIDVTVASIGNASSLRGGALLMTPLRGADGEVYAMAQGSMVVSGFGVSGKDGSRVSVNVPSSGRVPNGATVEREVGTHFGGEPIRHAESQHAGFHHRRAAQLARLNKLLGDGTAQAIDAVTVRVKAPADPAARVAFIGALQELEVEPGDAPARVIINSRTGTVVIGSHVRVMPAAVAHGSLSVTITERTDVSQPKPFSSRHDRCSAALGDHDFAAQRCAHVHVQRRRRSRRDRARGEPGGRRAGRPGGDPRGAAAGRRAARAADRDLKAPLVTRMSTPGVGPTYYADFNGLDALEEVAQRRRTRRRSAQAARQFESLFTNMMLKSMRDARLGRRPWRQRADRSSTRICSTSSSPCRCHRARASGSPTCWCSS